ncbi:MAG TPA: PspC domain-containing protein [Rubricoccaceae bacterium]|nr:PspC domain-containing protein [Rubricoccaceae bacterium]
MATRERPRQRPEETPEFEDDRLAYEAAFGLDDDITDEDVEEYLAEQAEEAERKEKKAGFLNLQTGAGLAIIAIGMVYLLQQIGFFPLGYSLGALVALLPWLAGILIILTGFGVLSWSPARRRRKARREARERRERRARRARAEKTAGRSAGRSAGAAAGAAFEQAWRSAERAVREAERRASRAASRSSARRDGRKRLAKSRKNKKIAGVASGIAEYLGVDPILIRIAFVIGAIFGNGFTIPLYLILAFVMPPAEDDDDDDDPVVTIVRDR